MLARDLDLLAGLAYERLSSEVIDVKRMLASRIHRLKADSWEPIAFCNRLAIRASFKSQKTSLRIHWLKV